MLNFKFYRGHTLIQTQYQLQYLVKLFVIQILLGYEVDQIRVMNARNTPLNDR